MTRYCSSKIDSNASSLLVFQKARSILFLLTIGASIASSASGASSQAEVLWLSLASGMGTESNRFENIALDYVNANPIFHVRKTDLAPQTLKDQLSILKQKNENVPIFIYCAIDDYTKMLEDSKMKSLLTDLRIELYNSRLISFPFYILFQSAATARKQQLLQFAFITLPAGEIDPIEEADVLTMLSQILRRPKNSIRLYRERGAYPTAKKLFDGTYDLIGIYEDEPSMLLDEFTINMTEELKAENVKFLNLDNPGNVSHLNEVAPNRLKYVYFSYEDNPFSDLETMPQQSVLVALAQQTKHPFPIVLSNVKYTRKETQPEFSRAFSYAYFLILPEISALDSGHENEKYQVQRMYLLNAYMNDSNNRFKGLGFLGYLMLMKDKKSKNPQEKEIYEAKCELLLKKLGVDVSSAQSIFSWLGLKMPDINKRELFSSDVSKLYEDALSRIDKGLKSTGKERIQNLEEAHRNLMAALLQGSQPRDVKGSRGLWSTTDYNPYYQLGRVTFYLELEKHQTAHNIAN